MGFLDYIEYSASWIFINAKGHDAGLFTKGPAFKDFPNPTFDLESPEIGPSNSHMKHEHTEWGSRKLPELKWAQPSPDVKQYVLIVEDPDAPFKDPGTHGLYYAIPANVTQITDADLEVLDGKSIQKKLKGPLKLGKNRRGTVYTGARPLLGHGPHRYFYELIALKEPVDEKGLRPVPTKDELAAAIVGKVAGWGLWVGIYENQKDGFKSLAKAPKP